MTIQISSLPLLSDSVQLAYTAFILNCITFSVFALGIFEYLITVHQEVSFIWCRRFTPVSALLLFLRYGALAFGGVTIASILVTGKKICDIMGRLSQAACLLLMVALCATSALRVHALSRKLWLVCTVTLLGMGPVVSNLILYLRTSTVTTSVAGARCLQVYQPYRGIPLHPVDSSTIIVARLSTALADLVVIIVTLKATLSNLRAAQRINMRVPLVRALLRDGTLYFLVALVMNIAQLILYETLQELYMISFIYMITPIMLSRLFLNLRKIIDNADIDPDPQCSTAFTIFDVHLHAQMQVEHGNVSYPETEDSRSSWNCSGNRAQSFDCT